jgi:hypothetical protein
VGPLDGKERQSCLSIGIQEFDVSGTVEGTTETVARYGNCHHGRAVGGGNALDVLEESGQLDFDPGWQSRAGTHDSLSLAGRTYKTQDAIEADLQLVGG